MQDAWLERDKMPAGFQYANKLFHEHAMHAVEVMEKQRGQDNVKLTIGKAIHVFHIARNKLDATVIDFVECFLGKINSRNITG